MYFIKEWIPVLLILLILSLLILVICNNYDLGYAYCEKINASYYRASEYATPVCLTPNGSFVPIKY